MSQHRISGLADPIEYDDAVTKRYVAAQVQALTDIIQDIRPVRNIVGSYNKMLGNIENQIVLLKYELRLVGWKEAHKNALLTFFF